MGTKTYKSYKTKNKFKIDEQKHFIAKGGEGSVYIIGDVVHKVCLDGKMIPRKKFEELFVLQRHNIIVPNDIIQRKEKDVGYSMPAVPNNPRTLAEIMTKPFRRREGITPDMMAKLVMKYVETVHFIHEHDGYLMVDGNEFNAMVPDTFDDVYFIDTNSYQTPNYPAEVIMPSVRDWHVAKTGGKYIFTKESDWYSTAIIAWYMLTAIHPFRGFHPKYTDKKTFMTEQMKACISVMGKDVSYPKGAVYAPFEDYIPGGKNGAWWNWFESMFVQNKRLAAPTSLQDTIKLVLKVREIIGSNTFNIQEIADYKEQITGYIQTDKSDIVLGKERIYFGRKSCERKAKKTYAGFTPKNNKPFVAWIESGKVKINNLETGSDVDISLSAKELMSSEGRVYALGEDNIFEVSFAEVANKIIPTPQVVASVMSNATQMYQGTAVQNNFGNYIVSIFSGPKKHHQFQMKELEEYKITDAKYENGILMVVGYHKSEDRYDRLVFRFGSDWNDYELAKKIENITPAGLNFTVLPSGMCLCITEEEKVEMFANKKGSTTVQVIDDPAISMDMHLCHQGDQVKFARDSKIYSFSMKK